MDTCPNDTVTVRSARQSDLASLCEIERSASNTPWSVASIAAELTRELAIDLVAVDTLGAIRGYIFAALAADELSIHYLVTHPEFRRRGIGAMLVRAAVDFAAARGARSVFLEVRSKNRAAIALYRQCGFMEQSLRRKYYSDDNDDAINMTIRIDDKL